MGVIVLPFTSILRNFLLLFLTFIIQIGNYIYPLYELLSDGGRIKFYLIRIQSSLPNPLRFDGESALVRECDDPHQSFIPNFHSFLLRREEVLIRTC
jgi:hypothetical protein